MTASPQLEWAQIADEAITHLRRMIQVDTTNPPGNELALAQYLAATLRADGISSRIVEATTNRGVLCARLPGNGSGRPILLTAHMDVVGVERDRWSSDPFGGEIRDGVVYGRGAIDDKGMLAANLMAFLLVKRMLVDRGVSLARDLVFLATSDEESGGDYGMQWVLRNHPGFLDAEFAINEGGRIRMANGVPLYAAVQTAEKVPTVLLVRARGPGGHAAIPLEGNAIARLARAVAAISATRLPLTLSPTTREFFGRLGTVWPDAEERAAMAAIASTDRREASAAEAVLARTPKLDALLRDTLSPTLLAAGTRHNVIPTSAEATMSLRTLPGHDPQSVIAALHAIVADPEVEITVVSTGCAAPVSDHESPMFAALRDALADLDPRIITVPYLSTGATESAYLRKAGIQCFGILPFPLSDDDEGRMHGHDERLSVDAFGFGVRLLYGTVFRMLVR